MVSLLKRRQVCTQLAAALLPSTLLTALPTPLWATAATAAPQPGARWLPWPKNRRTPPLELPDVEGVPWRLAQHQGHAILLNFWASWCEPCRAELPSLGLLAQQWQARGLHVVAVNFKESADSVRRVRDAQSLPLVWLRDTYGEAARDWGVRSFPTSVLVSPKGQALLSVQGEVDWADAGVQQRLQSQL
jgi:thiol-disulfide isomerase/thioredoxin